MNLNTDITYLKGVGPKVKEELNKIGIFNALDLLLYFPRDYEISCYDKTFGECEIDEKILIECKVMSVNRDVKTRTGKTITSINFNDGNSIFKGIWFNQPYMKNNFKVGVTYLIKGKVSKSSSGKVLSNPQIVRNTTIDTQGIIAKYPLRGKLTNTLFNKLITQLLVQIKIEENMPEWILKKYSLTSLNEAIYNIHSPRNRGNLEEAKRRLKFQELFMYSLKILMLKDYVKKSKKGIPYKMSDELVELKNSLPFNLTNAQSRVVREILKDQKSPYPMNRLVQGDVGSGKTIVALIGLFNVIKNGFQGAMMAPTEILATQHYKEATKILKEFNIEIELLTGSTTKKNKEIIKERLKNGEIQLVIGTHALIEENVEFKNLGFVITDEQHRFGVNQRCRFSSKNNKVDVLVMTATPIPRTLSLYLYGDLDISIIDELPPGRKPIETKFVNKTERDMVYEFALREIEKGRQIYIVCPLVEENEDLKLSSVESLHEELKEKYFKSHSIEILHGRMRPKEKDAIMREFKEGRIKALVSTTVIEVGVNVPNSSVMIIENAERFGLAQLHQLRGRVGRGEYQSYCLLIADVKSETTRRRMEIMTESNDGFYIAEEDLKLRGTGELFGIRQSGESELLLANEVEDIEMLKVANKEAKEVLNSKNEENVKIKKYILEKLDKITNYICYN